MQVGKRLIKFVEFNSCLHGQDHPKVKLYFWEHCPNISWTVSMVLCPLPWGARSRMPLVENNFLIPNLDTSLTQLHATIWMLWKLFPCCKLAGKNWSPLFFFFSIIDCECNLSFYSLIKAILDDNLQPLSLYFSICCSI